LRCGFRVAVLPLLSVVVAAAVRLVLEGPAAMVALVAFASVV